MENSYVLWFYPALYGREDVIVTPVASLPGRTGKVPRGMDISNSNPVPGLIAAELEVVNVHLNFSNPNFLNETMIHSTYGVVHPLGE